MKQLLPSAVEAYVVDVAEIPPTNRSSVCRSKAALLLQAALLRFTKF
jgi:hypothetical protein